MVTDSSIPTVELAQCPAGSVRTSPEAVSVTSDVSDFEEEAESNMSNRASGESAKTVYFADHT